MDNSDPSGSTDSESATLKFGRHAVADAFFTGTIDDVRLFDYPLTADEIKALYSGREPTAIVSAPAGQ